MSGYQPGDRYSAATAADLHSKRYYIVKTDSDGNIVLASAATDAILGVLDDGGRVSGDTCDVVLINGQGTFKVKVGATPVVKDAYLTADSNGLAIGTTSSGNRVFGRALTAGAAGEVIEYVKSNEKY